MAGITQDGVLLIHIQFVKQEPINVFMKGCNMSEPNWADKLMAKYPRLTEELPGFETGEGWKDLIEEMFDNIERVEATNSSHGVVYQPVRFVQIKEKFGGLRAYYEGGHTEEYDPNTDIRQIVSAAEEKSYRTCESCGTTNGVTTKGSWVLTLCDLCRGEREKTKLAKT